MTYQIPIPVTIEASGSPSQVPAILSELQFKLKRLIVEDCPDTLDLRSLPLFPGDYEKLKRLLGRGEVEAHIEAMGPSEIYETAIAGIWWITHRNSDNENVAEYLEITSRPDMLMSQSLDMQRGERLLKGLMTEIID